MIQRMTRSSDTNCISGVLLSYVEAKQFEQNYIIIFTKLLSLLILLMPLVDISFSSFFSKFKVLCQSRIFFTKSS
uniref:Uncharacterized protein n=1 Tax=Octopus bimaculoides TaxID=37653 RepID=A0A0L8FQ34_OCTBM